MFSAKVLFVVGCVLAVAAALPAYEGPLVGGKMPLTGEGLKEAEKVLVSSLAQVTSGDCTYEVEKVNSATSQVVAGVLYEFNADLKSCDVVKTCDIALLSQPWLNSGTITISCAGDKTFTEMIKTA